MSKAPSGAASGTSAVRISGGAAQRRGAIRGEVRDLLARAELHRERLVRFDLHHVDEIVGAPALSGLPQPVAQGRLCALRDLPQASKTKRRRSPGSRMAAAPDRSACSRSTTSRDRPPSVRGEAKDRCRSCSWLSASAGARIPTRKKRRRTMKREPFRPRPYFGVPQASDGPSRGGGPAEARDRPEEEKGKRFSRRRA